MQWAKGRKTSGGNTGWKPAWRASYLNKGGGVNLPDEYEVGREEHPVREGARDERRRDHRCARRAPGRRESAQPPGRRCGVRLGERAADTPAGARAAAVGAVGSMGWGCVRAFARRRARLRNAEAQYACTR